MALESRVVQSQSKRFLWWKTFLSSACSWRAGPTCNGLAAKGRRGRRHEGRARGEEVGGREGEGEEEVSNR